MLFSLIFDIDANMGRQYGRTPFPSRRYHSQIPAQIGHQLFDAEQSEAAGFVFGFFLL